MFLIVDASSDSTFENMDNWSFFTIKIDNKVMIVFSHFKYQNFLGAVPDPSSGKNVFNSRLQDLSTNISHVFLRLYLI